MGVNGFRASGFRLVVQVFVLRAEGLVLSSFCVLIGVSARTSALLVW